MTSLDFGTYQRPGVTCEQPAAAEAVGTALNRAWAFNHEDAQLMFEEARRLDGRTPLAHWGLAYCSWKMAGGTYNDTDISARKQRIDQALAEAAFDHIERAVQVATAAGVTPDGAELAIINAFCALVGESKEEWQTDDGALTDETVMRLNTNYACAMAAVYAAHPSDPDIVALFTEAMMQLAPWNLWYYQGEVADQWEADIKSFGNPPLYPPTGVPRAESAPIGAPRTLLTSNGREWNSSDVVEIIKIALHSHPDHLGLRHFYIHLVEMSQSPQLALEATVAAEFGSRSLTELCPGASHMIHMPSHIDVLVGDYQAAVIANQKAWEVDQQYLQDLAGGPDKEYVGYMCHNLHLLVYAAMHDGQFQTALTAAHELLKLIYCSGKVADEEGRDFFEGFLAVPLHVLIRFGKWQQVLSEDVLGVVPLSEVLHSEGYAATAASLHYARAVAHAVLGRTIFNVQVGSILEVAEQVLCGELLYRQAVQQGQTADFATAYLSLSSAVDLYDSLTYDEPWGFMQPVRHAHGALLLEQGQAHKAEQVFRADLGLQYVNEQGDQKTLPKCKAHPRNLWALRGLIEALKQQGKAEQVPAFQAQFDEASKRVDADINVKAACMCATAKSCCNDELE